VVSNHLAVFATGSGPAGSCDLWQDLVYAQPSVFDTGGTDLDGDGLPDLCARAAAGLRCYPARPGAGWGSYVQTAILANADGWEAEPRYASIRFGDVSGDGRADVCARDADGTVCWPSLGAGADGTLAGFGTAFRGPALTDAEGWSAPQYGSTLRMGDVDGDGRFDLCARSSTGIRCWRSTGTGFDAGFDGPALGDASGWDDPSVYGTLRMGDVTGDRKDDLCGRTSDGVLCWPSNGSGFNAPLAGPAWTDAAGWNATNAWGTIQLVDLDHDGRSDLCGRNSLGMACHLSTGTGFGEAILQPDVTDARGWGDDDNAHTFRFGDLDGDGDLDLCGRANAREVCWPFEGDRFGTMYDGPALSDTAGWNVRGTFDTLTLADVDGDGRADLLGRGPDGVGIWPSLGAAFGAEVTGPRFADSASWSYERYASTLRIVTPPYRRPADPVDTGNGDDTSTEPSDDTSGDTSRDSAVTHDSGSGVGAELPGAKVLPGGCGCMTPRRGASLWIPALAGMLATWALARRRGADGTTSRR
jgi:hypothetical protein